MRSAWWKAKVGCRLVLHSFLPSRRVIDVTFVPQTANVKTFSAATCTTQISTPVAWRVHTSIEGKWESTAMSATRASSNWSATMDCGRPRANPVNVSFPGVCFTAFYLLILKSHDLHVYSCMLSNFLWSPWRCPVRRLCSGRGRRFCVWIQSRLHLQQRVQEYSYVTILNKFSCCISTFFLLLLPVIRWSVALTIGDAWMKAGMELFQFVRVWVWKKNT